MIRHDGVVVESVVNIVCVVLILSTIVAYFINQCHIKRRRKCLSPTSILAVIAMLGYLLHACVIFYQLISHLNDWSILIVIRCVLYSVTRCCFHSVLILQLSISFKYKNPKFLLFTVCIGIVTWFLSSIPLQLFVNDAMRIYGLVDFTFYILCLSLLVQPAMSAWQAKQKNALSICIPMSRVASDTVIDSTRNTLTDITPYSRRSNYSNTLVVPSSLKRNSQWELNRNSMIIAPNPYKDSPRNSMETNLFETNSVLDACSNSCKDDLPPMIDVNNLSPVAIAHSLGSPTAPRKVVPHIPLTDDKSGSGSSTAFRSIAGMRLSASNESNSMMIIGGNSMTLSHTLSHTMSEGDY